MMATAGIISVAKWPAKVKQRSDVSCKLCKRAREQRSASTENLPEETYEHINCAFCDGMVTTVTAAHLLIGDICMPAFKLRKHLRVSSSLSHLMKSSIKRSGRRKNLSRYAAENR